MEDLIAVIEIWLKSSKKEELDARIKYIEEEIERITKEARKEHGG